MLTWFTKHAPFKTKLTLAFGVESLIVVSMAAIAAAGAIGLIDPKIVFGLGGGAVVLSLATAFVLIRVMTGPYVATVERLELLADGDLESPIDHTDHDDCVGRITAAMEVFRDAALAKHDSDMAADAARVHADMDRATHDADRGQRETQIELVTSSLAAGLAQLSNGNLAYRIEQPLGDADRLRIDFNESMARMQEALKAVGGSAQGIRAGSKEISGAADELARRTEKQAASLEQTAAALDGITVTVKKTAEGAVQARQAVATAKGDAEASGIIAENAVHAMKGIAASSRQIGQIIGVIDEIAFQTNLLALNAGVEAARAGEVGRGFAVVASEVRALAQRSAEAAKEIKALISSSSTHVDEGVELVIETGKALSRIVTRVSEINIVVTEIAGSAQEQATGLQEVNTAVTQMDQMTQQNAAMVEESTAASHAMMREAESLTHLLDKFETGTAKVVDLTSARAPQRAATPRAASYGGVTQGGAVRKAAPAPAAAEDGWEEF